MAIIRPIQVVSPGGCGSTYLASHLMRQSNLIGHQFKHVVSPEHLPPAVKKVIFVTGDPLLATLSLYRRDWAMLHFKHWQTVNNLNANRWSDFRKYHDDVVRLGKEFMGIERQFDLWLLDNQFQARSEKTLFISLQSIARHVKVLERFVGLSLVPPILKDRTSYEDRVAGLDARFVRIYDRLHEKIKHYSWKSSSHVMVPMPMTNKVSI